MLQAQLLTAQSEAVALRTGYQQRLKALAGLSEIVPNVPPAQPWYRRIGGFASPALALAITPVIAFPSADGGGAIGELSIAGDAVTRSGSALSEFRAMAWAPDAATTITANGLTGATWAHNLATQNRITLVYGDGSGLLGEVWVVRGSNTDTIYNTGSYRGVLHALTIRGINSRSVSQISAVVGASGYVVPAALDTLPLVMPEASANGYLGELYAERAATGWRIRRSGSANISCRIAVEKLI